MIKNVSLKQQLLFYILSSIIIGMIILFYLSYNNLKSNIDESQETLYSQKIDNIIYLIDQKNQKLQKTGMVDAYEEVFKKGTIDTVKDVFNKSDTEIYPFIIDSDNLFILHPKYNKKNSSLYKNEKNYLKLIKMKNGNFALSVDGNSRWIIFKYYEPWEWIIGYRVHIDVKYKELNRFRDDFIISSFLVLFIISMIIIFVVKIVLSPVRNLTEVSKKIASGNLEANIKVAGAVELQDLAKNFEKMRTHILIEMDALKKSEREIEALNKDLHKLVDERTEELKEQKESFETLFSESKDGLAIHKNGVFVDCNQSMLDLLGLEKKEDFIGLTPFDLSPKFQYDGRDSFEKGSKIIEECLEKGSVRFEWVFKRFNGEEFWAEVIITKVIISGELVIHANWRDISEKKELEVQLHNRNLDLQDSNDELETIIENLRQTKEELREQKENFETLFNKSKDGLCLVKDAKYFDCNQALLDMIKFDTKEEIVGLTPYDLSPEFQADGVSSKEAAKEKIKECMENGSARFEWLHKKSDGELFWTEIVITKLLFNSEVVIFSNWRNIQDKKELELEIKNKNYDLQESNDELEVTIENLKQTQNKLIESEKLAGLGSLVAGVAHEINTPVGIGLTGSSHLEYLSEDISEKYKNEQMAKEDFEEYLKSSTDLIKVINSNLERTAEIIKNFKQVAVDQTSEQKRVFRIKEYVKGLLISIDSITKQKDVEFKIDCPDDLEITSYPGFFAQIVTNLVANSVFHGFNQRDKGVISFVIKEDKGTLYIKYTDNGVGISKENISKIYEPFFTTNRENGGSGLGLNIVYNLVSVNLKGLIDCKSELEKGTTFIIEIPL